MPRRLGREPFYSCRVGTEAYEQGRTDIPLLDETIPHNLLRTIEDHEYREAIVSRHQGIRWNYYEFGERVRNLAKSMMHAGLEKGDRLGLWSPNYAEWTLVQFATAEIGVILVNINPAYRTHELAYAINQSGCRWIIAAPEVSGLGIATRPFASGFVRSSQLVGTKGALVL